MQVKHVELMEEKKKKGGRKRGDGRRKGWRREGREGRRKRKAVLVFVITEKRFPNPYTRKYCTDRLST